MDVSVNIDVARGDETIEADITNFDENVKIVIRGLYEGAIYIDRQELIQALCALDVGAPPV